MRYRLRTLLIVLAVGPPVLELLCPRLIRDYRAWRQNQAAEQAFDAILATIEPDKGQR